MTAATSGSQPSALSMAVTPATSPIQPSSGRVRLASPQLIPSGRLEASARCSGAACWARATITDVLEPSRPPPAASSSSAAGPGTSA